eukprot:g15330.t1
MADYMSNSRVSDARRKTRRVTSERRRLTLGTVDKKESSSGASSSSLNGNATVPRLPTDSSGLITFLKKTNVTDVVRGSEKKRLSLSSHHTDVHVQQSFDEKATVGGGGSTPGADAKRAQEKTREELNRLGIGIACKKGMKPESPNQDAFSVMYACDEFLLTGVYDGHGAHGHHVSQFVKDTLPKLFLNDPNRSKDPCSALRESFSRCQKLIEHGEKHATLQAGMSGSTCTLAYQPLQGDKKGQIFIAYVGDSRACMVSRARNGGKGFTGRSLTEDHKPSLPAEKARIEAGGGRVLFDGFFNHRVFAKGQMYPGLNIKERVETHFSVFFSASKKMSRAFGDCVAHREAGLCAEPEITIIRVQPDDVGLLVCSDGVWEFLDGATAAQCAMGAVGGGCADGAEQLAKVSWAMWMEDSDNEISDDITAVLVMFDKIYQQGPK